MAKSTERFCCCCFISVPLNSPECVTRDFGGKRVRAHSECLNKYRYIQARRLVGEQIDEYAGGHLFQCKRWLNQGRSFRTRVQSMRRILKQLYFNGTGSDYLRRNAIMLVAVQLEEMMIEDFTTCLSLPPQQCA